MILYVFIFFLTSISICMNSAKDSLSSPSDCLVLTWLRGTSPCPTPPRWSPSPPAPAAAAQPSARPRRPPRSRRPPASCRSPPRPPSCSCRTSAQTSPASRHPQQQRQPCISRTLCYTRVRHNGQTLSGVQLTPRCRCRRLPWPRHTPCPSWSWGRSRRRPGGWPAPPRPAPPPSLLCLLSKGGNWTSNCDVYNVSWDVDCDIPGHSARPTLHNIPWSMN